MSYLAAIVLNVGLFYLSAMGAEHHANNGLHSRATACVRSAFGGFILGAMACGIWGVALTWR